jgi:purine-binding chemotaxis protein CheW
MISKKQKNTFLSFGIHKETFAVSVKKVPEVLQKQYITKIPNTPAFIKGVINFRGNIIPAVEMRTKFGLPPRSQDEQYVIIVFDLNIDNKKIMVGAIADKVNDVIAFEDADIKPVPDLGLEYNAEFIKGMVKSGESFTMILDIDKIFSKEEVNIISKAKITNGKNTKKQSPQSPKEKTASRKETKNSKNTKK